MLKWRHIFALNGPEMIPNWHQRITLDYTAMGEAFKNNWADNYTKRKRILKTILAKVEPRTIFMDNVKTFLDYAETLGPEKIIIAGCHGGTCRFIMNALKIKSTSGKIVSDGFKIHNVDAFSLKLTADRAWTSEKT